jgi:hypothetical protein
VEHGEGWRKGETWSSKVNPDGPIEPEAIKIHLGEAELFHFLLAARVLVRALAAL